jgi:large subunit ribosomal protein L24
MKIKKGDQVIVISGKDRGRKGKVLKVFPKAERIMIEGINLRKKHLRPKRSGEKGQIIETLAPIHVSNIKIICAKCGKATRISYKIEKKEKYRICKKCAQEV